MTRRRFWTVTAFLTGSLLLAAWTVFLLRLGLDRADKASSVASAVLTLVFGVAGVWLALASRPQPSPPEPSGQTQINTAKDQGKVYGVQHGNMIIGDAPRPPDGR